MVYANVLKSITLFALAHDGWATMLPSFRADSASADEARSRLEASSRWWLQVGDSVYHQPPDAAHSALSGDIKDYYYAIGSSSGVPAQLQPHRVGGAGRWHIFHLPGGGASLLQTDYRGDRRASLSELKRIQKGQLLAAGFPEFKTDKSYTNPLDEKGQEAEKKAVADISETSYKEYLTKLSENGGLGTRAWDNKDASEKAVSFLEEEFKKLDFKVCTHKFKAPNGGSESLIDGGEKELVNVLAFAPGKGADAIVVGAHYDSRPYSGPAPGAVDNGSGAAGLMEMARAFSASKVKPSKPVIFAAFAGEEAGLLGSDAFAKELVSGAKAIPDDCKPVADAAEKSFLQTSKKRRMASGAIIMDEIGWLTNTKMYDGKPTVNLESHDDSDAYGTGMKAIMQHLEQSNKDHNQEPLNVVHSNNPFGSDHMSFLNEKMPAILTIQGDDEAYPDYHKETDKIENVDFGYAAKIVKMNMGALLRMSGIETGETVQLAQKKEAKVEADSDGKAEKKNHEEKKGSSFVDQTGRFNEPERGYWRGAAPADDAFMSGRGRFVEESRSGRYMSL